MSEENGKWVGRRVRLSIESEKGPGEGKLGRDRSIGGRRGEHWKRKSLQTKPNKKNTPKKKNLSPEFARRKEKKAPSEA